MVAAAMMRVKSVRWVAPSAAAGNAVVIQDANDKILWETIATGANYTEEAIVENWWMSGFKVPTLASGVLYVTLSY